MRTGLAVVVAVCAAGCTLVGRVGVGPAVGSDGSRGGVVVATVGGALGGSTAAMGALTTAPTFAVGARRGELRRTYGASYGSYADLDAQPRIGLSGSAGIVYGRRPQPWRDRVGFHIEVGPRLRLAGTEGHLSMGSCGLGNNYGDRWGLYAFVDVAYDMVDGDARRVHRASFPAGLEFRLNVVPSSDSSRTATEFVGGASDPSVAVSDLR